MGTFVVKFLLSLLFISLITPCVLAGRFHKHHKNGKNNICLVCTMQNIFRGTRLIASTKPRLYSCKISERASLSESASD